VYKINPHRHDEPKQNVQDCFWNVMTETLHETASIMRKRVDACLAERGGNFQRLL